MAWLVSGVSRIAADISSNHAARLARAARSSFLRQSRRQMALAMASRAGERRESGAGRLKYMARREACCHPAASESASQVMLRGERQELLV